MTHRVYVGIGVALALAAGGRSQERSVPVPQQRTGGACTYDQYPGKATITRIEQTAPSRAQVQTARYEGCEVWFTFEADGQIPQTLAAAVLQKEHLFLLMNSWYPGPKYVEKYGLAVGKSYPCTVNIITAGTCTPVFFEFEKVDRRDFFESRGGAVPNAPRGLRVK